MIIPVIPDKLFEISENPIVSFSDDVIYIDNIFKNYNDILEFAYNSHVERWKSSEISKNFKDYYDCRMVLSNNSPDEEKQREKFYFYFHNMKKYFNLQKQIYFDSAYSFNYFKNLHKNVPDNIQHHPHYDHAFNIIHYIDTHCSGGTAIYENVDNWQNNEHDNLLYDTSKLKIKQIVKAKPNRCVIFKGENLHGGYINEHDVYYYNWRINLVNFVREVE